MSKLFRTAVLAALSFGLLLSQSKVATAQTVKDRAAVVFKISSIDKVLDSTGYMVGAAGFRNFVPMITLGAGAFLDGFDTSRPIGGYLTLDDGAPQFVGFVPVNDLEDVIDMLENNGVDVEEDGGDYIIVTPTGEEVVVRGKGKWAFFSANAEMLDELPEDPTKIIADISDEYMIGVKAYVQRIPADLRSQAIEWMEEAFQQTNNNLPEGAAELQRKINENSLDQLADMIQQADQIFFGFAPDKKNKRLYFDFTFTGKDGSELAENLTAGKGASTEFASILKNENAAITFNSAVKVNSKDAATAKGTFKIIKDEIGGLLSEDGNLSEDDVKLFENTIGDLVDVVSATLDSGKMDLGGGVLIGDKGINVVAGAHISNAKKVEAAVKKLIAEKGNEIPDEVTVELDASTYKGVTFHKFSGSIPDEEAHAILGETTTLLVGIGKSKVFIGFGEGPMEKVKALIDGVSSQKAEPPTQFNIKLSPILRLAGKASDQEMLIDMADKLEEEGNQMIKITSDFIKNGQKSRFEVQDGVLSLIGVGAAGFGGGGGFGGDF